MRKGPGPVSSAIVMKTRMSALPYALPLAAALGLACGTTPPEGTATGTEGSTGTGTSAASVTDTTPTTGGSVSDSATTTASTTQGSMSEGQTDATTGTTTDALTSTDPTTGTTTSPVTSDSDSTTDPNTSDTDTSTGDTTSGTTSGTTGDTTTGDSSSTTDDTTGEAVDCGLQLKATIRDFKLPHPDFETYCCGVVQGLVKPDLGANKKPVFNMAGGMLTDAATFDQWYNNVADVNQATQITLELAEIMPGVYSYQNNDFFPIDNQLFGNQGNNHNFHFTTVPDTS